MGFGGDHLAWAFQVRALAEHYRVVTFDNRGAGQSDAPKPPYTIRTMADDTAGLLPPPRVQSAGLDGGTLGGVIAHEEGPASPGGGRGPHLGGPEGRPATH